MFSSPMVSAYLGGRRVVSIQPGLVDADRGMLSRRGFIPRVETEQELIKALEAPIRNSHALRSALHNSTARLAAAVIELIQPCQK